MSEENTIENQAPSAPDQSFPDPEEGELSEDDLEATAGGHVRFGNMSEIKWQPKQTEGLPIPVPPHLLLEGP